MIKVFALRLKPNTDLKASLKNFVNLNNIKAGYIITTVGSLKQATIRFANQTNSQVFNEKFEIVSLSGTLAASGIHVHMAIADQQGKVIGGHLDYGCIIYTTAEIVIGESLDFVLIRNVDQATGFKELEISPTDTLNES